MTECLRCVERTARKNHECDLCLCTIKKGEKYNYGTYKDDFIFEWKTHKRCDFISIELGDLADPDYGMNSDDFHEACAVFCHVFVCPDCSRFDKEYKECDEDRSFCLDRIYALLQTHRLVHHRYKYGMMYFKVVPREEGDTHV